MSIASIGIYCFSGAGNTEVISDLLRDALRRGGVRVEIRRMEDILKGRVPNAADTWDMLGIAHPIYGFAAPRIVHRFLRELPLADGKRVFLLKSAADFLAINHAASGPVIRQLEERGYEVVYDRIICMPCTWLIGYPDSLSRQLHAVAIAKTEHMCMELLAGKSRRLSMHPTLKALARLVGVAEAWGARFFGKELRVSSACVDCGRCIQECPTGNIRREDGHTRFGWDCLWCMRCIYACPQRAISPRFSRFFVLEGGYDLGAILVDGSPDDALVNADTRGYFKHFWRYVRDIEV